MTFGEHLEELRSRLIRSLAITAVGALIALFFADTLMKTIAGPHQQAMSRVLVRQRADQAAEDLAELAGKLGELSPEAGYSVFREHSKVSTLGERATQLRAGLLEEGMSEGLVVLLMEQINAATTVAERAAYYGRMQRAFEQIATVEEQMSEFPHAARDALREVLEQNQGVEGILRSWQEPKTSLVDVPWPQLDRRLHEYEGIRNRIIELENWRNFNPPLKTLSYPEAFFSYLKICILAGLLLGLPWITFEVWGFISAGLYKSERRAVYPFIPMSFAFFIAGFVFAYNVLIPIGLAYLGGYASPDVIEGNFTLRDYISLIITMMLGMGLLFQLPLGMIFLSRAQILTTAQFRQYRKMAIFGAVIVGAMLTPPDPVTQMLMAGPLVLLYESGVWGSIFFARKKSPERTDSSD